MILIFLFHSRDIKNLARLKMTSAEKRRGNFAPNFLSCLGPFLFVDNQKTNLPRKLTEINIFG